MNTTSLKQVRLPRILIQENLYFVLRILTYAYIIKMQSMHIIMDNNALVIRCLMYKTPRNACEVPFVRNRKLDAKPYTAEAVER